MIDGVSDGVARVAISNHGLRNSGGIERYALTLVGGLHARGIRPTVLAKSFDPTLPEFGWVDAVPLSVRAAPGQLRDLFFDWRIGRAKRRLGLFPLIACNQTRWSDIGICGGTHPGFLTAMGKHAGLSDRLKTALERAHLHGSRRIVAHSGRVRDEMIRFYGIDPAKITLLYPPVDATKFSTVSNAARERLRAELGFDAGRAVVLLASTGHSRKGLDLLAPCFAGTELPMTLVIAGRPPPRPLPNVRYLGYRHDIENVFRAVDFTIMASRYEPFGLVGVESVLCGTPVLMADNIGCAEVIQGDGRMLFSLDDPEAMGRVLRQAAARWQEGTHRLVDPSQWLAYDPRVEVHIDALLDMVRAVQAHG